MIKKSHERSETSSFSSLISNEIVLMISVMLEYVNVLKYEKQNSLKAFPSQWGENQIVGEISFL